MPAKDRYHDAVKRALVKDGWIITGEQVRLSFGERNLWVDLEARKSIDERVILVEVKELDDVNSHVEALANAVGKYLLYRMGLADVESDTPLYLAVTKAAFDGILSDRIGKHAITQLQISLLVFDPEQEEIVKWLP